MEVIMFLVFVQVFDFCNLPQKVKINVKNQFGYQKLVCSNCNRQGGELIGCTGTFLIFVIA